MSKRSLRVTGFTRFIIVMIIVAPLAYLAASYYNGEDGVQNLKNMFGMDKQQEQVSISDEEPENPSAVSSEIKTLQEENRRLQEELNFKSKRVDELYKENEELKRRLETLEKVVDESKTTN
jgi:predicted nuclease with TOPRIM domain